MIEQVLDPRYAGLICFNCGEPGHFVGNCVKSKVCFICNVPGHPVNNCTEWVNLPPAATFFGSAARGLGFFHVEVPTASEILAWLQLKPEQFALSELEQKLSGIFCTQKL